MKKLLLSIVTASLLAGCAARPSQDEITNADYGEYPNSYENVIKNYMFRTLKDPDSAQYQFLNHPKNGWTVWGGKKFGYVVCAYINAKNSYGGYTGSKLSYFMIRNNAVVSHIGGGDQYSESAAKGACEPFV